MAEKFRKDYKFPDFEIKTVELTFQIFNGHTEVHSLLFVVFLVRNPDLYSTQNEFQICVQVLAKLYVKKSKGAKSDSPLILDGENLTVNKILVDGRVLSTRYDNCNRSIESRVK